MSSSSSLSLELVGSGQPVARMVVEATTIQNMQDTDMTHKNK